MDGSTFLYYAIIHLVVLLTADYTPPVRLRLRFCGSAQAKGVNIATMHVLIDLIIELAEILAEVKYAGYVAGIVCVVVGVMLGIVSRQREKQVLKQKTNTHSCSETDLR